VKLQTLKKKAKWALKHRPLSLETKRMLEELLTHPHPESLPGEALELIRQKVQPELSPTP